jgi:hypothetical protein
MPPRAADAAIRPQSGALRTCRRSDREYRPRSVLSFPRLRRGFAPACAGRLERAAFLSEPGSTKKKQQKALLEKLRETQIKAAEDAKARRKKHELAGALVVAELDANPAGPFAVALKELLHSGLKRASQRALFGLPPLPSAPKAE